VNSAVQSPSRADAERRVRVERKAIAFVDCCGFSAYTHSCGDEAAVHVYLQLRAWVEHAALAARVSVVKWIGDGVMLAGDSSASVISCLSETMLEVRRAGGLPIRAGMTVGSVATLNYDGTDYFGATVNLAARLCAQAAPWCVRTNDECGRRTLDLPVLVPEPGAATAMCTRSVSRSGAARGRAGRRS
jgi:class 3 adenylate cyclase